MVRWAGSSSHLPSPPLVLLPSFHPSNHPSSSYFSGLISQYINTDRAIPEVPLCRASGHPCILAGLVILHSPDLRAI